jgi:hypothetical protein
VSLKHIRDTYFFNYRNKIGMSQWIEGKLCPLDTTLGTGEPLLFIDFLGHRRWAVVDLSDLRIRAF